MIWAVEGELFHLEPTIAVIRSSNGIYYEINIGSNFYNKYCEKIGEKILVNTYMNVKENLMELFGFRNIEEKDFFIHLIGVSGVGAKKGLDIINAQDLQQYYQAIENKEPKIFQKVKGIGAKQSQKIILELAGKIDFEKDADNLSENIDIGAKTLLKDVESGLINLGFNQKAIKEAIKKSKKEIEKIDEFDKAFKIVLAKCSKF